MASVRNGLSHTPTQEEEEEEEEKLKILQLSQNTHNSWKILCSFVTFHGQ
jgi:hypothetical protein